MERASSSNPNEGKVQQPLISSEQENDEVEGSEEEVPACSQRMGLIWSILAAVSAAVGIVLIQKLSFEFNPIMVMFYNQAILLIFVIFLPWNESMAYNWYDLLLNLLFGLGDTLGKSALITALSFIPAGDVSAISLNKPIPASLVACILLGELFDAFDGALVVVNCIGLVLIAESAAGISNDSSNVYGVLCAFIALSSFVFTYFVARVLAKKGNANPSLLSFMAGWIGVVLSFIYLTLSNAWHFPGKVDDSFMLLALGCSTIIHFYSLTKALQTENMMFVAAGMSIAIPITYIYDALFSEHKLAWQNIVGAVLTVSSTLLLFAKTSCKEE